MCDRIQENSTQYWSSLSVVTYEARVRFGTPVQVQVLVRDSTIFEKIGSGCGGTQRLKNYYKYFYLYFLYIFTIKILLKNTLLSLIHKKNKEEGKKHITMPLRWEFRLFQPNSRPISTCFYRFGRWPTQPDSGWISLVRRKSKPNRCKSSRVGTNLRKKKKKFKRSTDTQATASDSGAAPSQPRPCFPGCHNKGSTRKLLNWTMLG